MVELIFTSLAAKSCPPGTTSQRRRISVAVIDGSEIEGLVDATAQSPPRANTCALSAPRKCRQPPGRSTDNRHEAQRPRNGIVIGGCAAFASISSIIAVSVFGIGRIKTASDSGGSHLLLVLLICGTDVLQRQQPPSDATIVLPPNTFWYSS